MDAADAIPSELGTTLQSVIAFMAKKGLHHLRIVAHDSGPQMPQRHGSQADFTCFEPPAGEGLLGVYVIADDAGAGRLEGPSDIPQSVLRPLLRRMDELHLTHLSIDAIPLPRADALDSMPMQVSIPTAVLDREAFCDVEEDEHPSGDGTLGVFITVRNATDVGS